MKNIFYFLGLIMLIACNSNRSNYPVANTDSLFSIIYERDSALSDFVISFNEIETNLDSVAARQRIISMNTAILHSELLPNKKERINNQIIAINNLMDKNRKLILDLKKRMVALKNRNELLEKTIVTLTIQLSQKDYDLCELNLKLDGLNAKVTRLTSKVDSLSTQNYIKSIVIQYQDEHLNTAYYIVGEMQYLINEKIIDRKGGFLGIGKSTELNENFDNTMFNKIDAEKTTIIPINAKEVKLITNHPTDAYTLDVDSGNKNLIKNILITNPIKFWSTSKYLVIVKK